MIETDVKPQRFAMVGFPNAGKTSLFNRLTGAYKKVGNWQGVTVSHAEKHMHFSQSMSPKTVIDLPGVQDLLQSPESMDVAVDMTLTRDFLQKQPIDGILNVVDATQLEQHLYLTAQLLELQLPMCLIINKMDLAQQKKISINTKSLSQKLGIPVYVLGQGDESAFQELQQKFLQPSFCQKPTLQLNYPDQIESMLQMQWVEQEPYYGSLRALRLSKLALHSDFLISSEIDIHMAQTRHIWAQHISQSVSRVQLQLTSSISNKLDALLLHRIWGVPCFFAIMYMVFMLAIGLGNAFIDLFNRMSGYVFVEGLGNLLTQLGTPDFLTLVLSQGMGVGIQTVITFIPVMMPLFIALSFLDSSGYMSRASFVIEGAMHRIGLPGKAFVPMVVGFGCSVPAIMATRSLDKKRERIITGMMTPFMSCGARLPIYVLFATTFFADSAQSLVFVLYLIGVIAAIGTGLLLSNTVLSGHQSFQMTELTHYAPPQVGMALKHAYKRMMSFIRGEGKIIVIAVTFLCVLNHISFKGEISHEDSILQQSAQFITPVFQPMGIEEENWPATVGIIVGFFAKEVVVGTLDSLYSQQTGTVVTKMPSLSQAWQEATQSLRERIYQWTHVFNENTPETISTYSFRLKNLEWAFSSTASAFSYLLFILLYTPCISAIAALIKEFGYFWALSSGAWTLFLAFSVSILYYQGSLFLEQPFISSIWFACTGFAFCCVYWILRRQSKKTPELIPILEIN